jgi:hypothetical protein
MAGFGGQPWWSFRESWRPNFNNGLLERHLSQLTTSSEAKPEGQTGSGDPVRTAAAVKEDTIDPLARPRGFLAVVDGNPGIDLGGLEVEERDSVHMLMGTW